MGQAGCPPARTAAVGSHTCLCPASQATDDDYVHTPSSIGSSRKHVHRLCLTACLKYTYTRVHYLFAREALVRQHYLHVPVLREIHDHTCSRCLLGSYRSYDSGGYVFSRSMRVGPGQLVLVAFLHVPPGRCGTSGVWVGNSISLRLRGKAAKARTTVPKIKMFGDLDLVLATEGTHCS
jgi:hypothetical protein